MDRNGVDVSGNHNTVRPTKVRACDQSVPVPHNVKMRAGTKKNLDCIREGLLVARD